MSEHFCPPSVSTLSDLTSSTETESSVTEDQQEPTHELVGATEGAESRPVSDDCSSSSQLSKTTASPLASPRISLPEADDNNLGSCESGENGTISSRQDDANNQQHGYDEASPEDLQCWVEECLLDSGCPASWPSQQLGLDTLGRSYWPGRYSQVSVFLPRSNWPASDSSCSGRERMSPLLPASLAADGSCTYLYDRLSRGATSSMESGTKASGACVTAFVFAVVVVCVWMFQVVGEYHVPESGFDSSYVSHMVPSIYKAKAAGDIGARAVFVDANGTLRQGHVVERIPSRNGAEEVIEVRKNRERPARKTTILFIPYQLRSNRGIPRVAEGQRPEVHEDKAW